MQGSDEDSLGLLTVLYGTQKGNAEQLAFTFVSLAVKRGFKKCRCLPADEFSLDLWRVSSPLVIICSNANQGEAPDSIRFSWKRLLEHTAPSMEGLRFAVFGTGDSLYPKFNYMAKMLHNRLMQLGGEPIINRGLGDESDEKGYDQIFLPWVTQLWKVLGLLPSSTDFLAEDPLTAPLLSKYNVTICDASRSKTGLLKKAHYNEKIFESVVRQNVRLTAEDHFQVVHHVTLSRLVTFFEGDERHSNLLAFEVGDALGVYCKNQKSMVDYFFAQTKLSGDTVICVTPNSSEGLVEQAKKPFFGKPMTLYFFIQHYVDLEAVANRSFFNMLSRFADDGEIKERLAELASSDNMDDFMSYSYREKRNVVEVLADFYDVRPPLSVLLSFMPSMQPRLFSIASSPSFDMTDIHLTVAKLSWQTPYKRSRVGLCSSLLVDSSPGDVLTCFLWPGTMVLPLKPSPLICVGTGTGVAPLRALIRECAASAEVWRDIPVLLFFGCRYEKKDYLYFEEWRDLAENRLKKLSVLPAFSRDGDKKFYVQNQLARHAKHIGELLDESSYIYICGNSTPMPKDVTAVFEDIVTHTCCGGDSKRGEEYMKQLRREGRYIIDSWST